MMTKIKGQKIIIYLLIIILLVFYLALSSSLYWTYQSFKAMKNLDLKRGELYAKKAQFLPRLLNKLSFEKIPCLVIWHESLSSIVYANDLITNGQLLIAENFLSNNEGEIKNQNNSQLIKKDLEKINESLNKIDKAIYESFIIYSATLLNSDFENTAIALHEKLELAINLTELGQYLITEQKYLLIILQNNDELRASGGFMGSYINLQLLEGQVLPFSINDIYSAAGQYRGYKPAPPGMSEYLSAGQGMSLVDANWSADFPTAANEILSFFQEIYSEEYDGLIAVNSSLIERLLSFTGPIYLPDYQKTISADNFAQLAREDRQNFFPGSTAKSDFLNSAMNNLKIKLSQMNQEEMQQLLRTLQTATIEKDLLFYSQDSHIENILQNWQIAGQMLNIDLNCPYYYLVESNVGINKANQLVERSVELQNIDQNTNYKVTFSNHNQDLDYENLNPNLLTATHLNYVNYLRLYLSKNAQVETVTINGQKHDFRQTLVKNSQNQEFLEVALLIVVWAQEKTEVEFKIKQNTTSCFQIQKQAGVKEIPVTINYQGVKQSLNLKNDQTVFFDQEQLQ